MIQEIAIPQIYENCGKFFNILYNFYEHSWDCSNFWYVKLNVEQIEHEYKLL